MFITVENENLFNSPAEALVNPVNCVGVMGAGLALQFRINYPENYGFYRRECELSNLLPGHCLLFKEKGKWIINFPTKNDWREASKSEYIYFGCKDLENLLVYHDIKSVAIPALGCGLGKLNWKNVKETIETALKNVSEFVDIYLYPPKGK
jgi:O-acetyl-ADP-ribose deacetylase (regulator of RNase III)